MRACTVSVISLTLVLPCSRSRASYLTSKGTPALSPMAVPSVLLVTSTWTPTNCGGSDAGSIILEVAAQN